MIQTTWGNYSCSNTRSPRFGVSTTKRQLLSRVWAHMDIFFMVRSPYHPLGRGEQWNERTKIKDDNIIIFFFWVSFEIWGHTRGFYTTRGETQLFAYTLSGITIFVSPSHISCAGISQGSFHGIHCSQLDATNCPTTILRNSLFCFSNLENKGALQAALTGKSYIFNSKKKGIEKKEISFRYTKRLPLPLQSALSAWPTPYHFSTSAKKEWTLYSLRVQKLILGNSPVKRGFKATGKDSWSAMKLMETTDYSLLQPAVVRGLPWKVNHHWAINAWATWSGGQN